MTDHTPYLRVVTDLPEVIEETSFFMDLGQIHIDESKNARTRYEVDAEMAKSLKQEGQLTPLICVVTLGPDQKRRIELREGFSRVRAWKKLYPDSWQLLRVEVKIRNVERKGADRMAGFVANMARRNLRKVEQHEEVWRLHREDGYTLEYIANATLMSIETLKSYIRTWGGLCPEIKRAWKAAPEGTFVLAMLVEWAGLPSEETQRAALKKFLEDPDPENEPRALRRKRPRVRVIESEIKKRRAKGQRSAFEDGFLAALEWSVGKADLPE